jgi:hypothetical protein
VRGSQHRVKGSLLVGAKFHVVCVCMNIVLHEKAGSASPLPISIAYEYDQYSLVRSSTPTC